MKFKAEKWQNRFVSNKNSSKGNGSKWGGDTLDAE